MGEKVSTEVTGDVEEYHFRCAAGHEFSVLAKGMAVDSVPICVEELCPESCELLGRNQAEIEKEAGK